MLERLHRWSPAAACRPGKLRKLRKQKRRVSLTSETNGGDSFHQKLAASDMEERRSVSRGEMYELAVQASRQWRPLDFALFSVPTSSFTSRIPSSSS